MARLPAKWEMYYLACAMGNNPNHKRLGLWMLGNYHCRPLALGWAPSGDTTITGLWRTGATCGEYIGKPMFSSSQPNTELVFPVIDRNVLRLAYGRGTFHNGSKSRTVWDTVPTRKIIYATDPYLQQRPHQSRLNIKRNGLQPRMFGAVYSIDPTIQPEAIDPLTGLVTLGPLTSSNMDGALLACKSSGMPLAPLDKEELLDSYTTEYNTTDEDLEAFTRVNAEYLY